MAVTGVVAATALTFAQPESPSLRNGTKRFAMRVVTAGLADPWEVAWGPDGMLWVTERPALRITRVDPTTGAHHVAATLDGTATAAGSGGVLGMALHPQLLRHTGHDEVYVAVTYIDMARPADLRFSDPASPFRHLYSKVVRLRYDAATATLVDPVTILDGLPAGNDHYGMRLAFGPDGTLHLTTGDQGGNQLGNYCHPIYSQQLPTQAEVDARDWSAYEGKTLRLTTDGGIPADNPVIGGVRSHVYTYGHRNPQGITMGVDGTMYTSDHGPKSDDEVNVLVPGGNYGWPHVAGYRDDTARTNTRAGATRRRRAPACASAISPFRRRCRARPSRRSRRPWWRRSQRCSRYPPATTSRTRRAAACTISAGRRSLRRASKRTHTTTASRDGTACSSCRP